MTQALIDQITRAVLYEGYILYPYRPSVKNTQRWTFGGLYPKAFCLTQGGGADSWLMQTEGLVQGPTHATVTITVRFLHLVQRTVGRLDSPRHHWPATHEPPFQPVASLTIGDRRYHTWQEAVERTVPAGQFALSHLLAAPRHLDFSFPAARSLEPLPPDSTGDIVGFLLRQQQSITGAVELSAAAVTDTLIRLTVRILNQTAFDPFSNATRDEALLRSLVSTHTILNAQNGRFISLMDPPPECREAVAACQNLGAWPVLVGAPTAPETLLSSPIVLYDYPQIAPESPGDLFDGTEIDEILTLRILTLTDQEKQDMRAVDEHARALLQRTEALGAPELNALHGTLRQVTQLRPGDRVRLHPHPADSSHRTDIFDLALAGKTAVIAAVERDYENRLHVAVTVDDDPGQDFGHAGKPAHRFFFRPDELEPLSLPPRSTP